MSDEPKPSWGSRPVPPEVPLHERCDVAGCDATAEFCETHYRAAEARAERAERVVEAAREAIRTTILVGEFWSEDLEWLHDALATYDAEGDTDDEG